MPNYKIRNIPEDTYATLRANAKRTGGSIQTEIMRAIKAYARYLTPTTEYAHISPAEQFEYAGDTYMKTIMTSPTGTCIISINIHTGEPIAPRDDTQVRRLKHA